MGSQASSLEPEELAELQKLSTFSLAEINSLYRRFQHLDKENIGRIALEELHAIPELAVNPLAQRIHAVFDLDGRNEIDFRQFLSVLSVFSKDAKREEKLNFAFRIYDVNGDGLLDKTDLTHIVKLMVGSNVPDIEVEKMVQQTIMDADTLDRDGAISFAEFKRAMFNADVETILTIQF
ncbi:hypothetical protein BDV3_005346 [Batrachochytrium dendrobatidis]|uniref:Calcineurin subunit B n=2 Tax=Batrachochytrium dendrobatidis TaxID=109871 RepID=A0A177WHE4_BATDL|nr:hypothetical protein O5D80_003412 [Batrachochytrium dendrobatidis]KAK5667028.1 hypothetical protein QVD99_006244 [Batrachochytrium dendrobatidis]OAJ39538.1 hypothetical protein BDEG_23377 [Batrachochytrium dendrobatidis JEL423]